MIKFFSIRFFVIITIVVVIFYPLQKLFSLPLASDFYFKSDGDITLNQDNKTIKTDNKVFFINNKNTYSANNLTVWYQDLKNLDLDHINRIEANGDVSIITSNHQKITGDRYVYSLSAGAHVLQSIKKPVVYKDELRTLTTKDRIEYFIKENVVVVRGNPKVIGKSNLRSQTSYHFSANLINLKLKDSNSNHKKTVANKNNNELSNNKDIEFAEAIGNVNFKENDTSIKANYAIYYKKQNQIEFYNNVIFHSNEGNLKGCSAIYNLNSGYGRLIPCSKESGLTGTYKPKQKITK